MAGVNEKSFGNLSSLGHFTCPLKGVKFVSGDFSWPECPDTENSTTGTRWEGCGKATCKPDFTYTTIKHLWETASLSMGNWSLFGDSKPIWQSRRLIHGNSKPFTEISNLSNISKSHPQGLKSQPWDCTTVYRTIHPQVQYLITIIMMTE